MRAWVAAGIVAASLAACLPAWRAVGRLEALHRERAALAGGAAATVAPPAMPRRVDVAPPVEAAARASGAAVRTVPLAGRPGRLRVQAGGREAVVLDFVNRIERDPAGIRFETWRIVGTGGGGVRMDGVAAAGGRP